MHLCSRLNRGVGRRKSGRITLMNDGSSNPPAVKDVDAQHAIAGAWRPMLGEVVRSFVNGDYGLVKGIAGVEPVGDETAKQIEDYLSDYGATLSELPDETWQTSVAQWMGTHWDVLIDLWTTEEGRSDLVLAGRVEETNDGPRFSVSMVYVP
jgi:hypothetical protein